VLFTLDETLTLSSGIFNHLVLRGWQLDFNLDKSINIEKYNDLPAGFVTIAK
jgi:hypothetical protein